MFMQAPHLVCGNGAKGLSTLVSHHVILGAVHEARLQPLNAVDVLHLSQNVAWQP